jgi:cyclic pyranopterin phosphate synthase
MSTDSPAPIDRLGRPLHDLRISVTDRCNLRCTYCMPAEVYDHEVAYVQRSKVLRFEEIERLTRLFVQLGARKLRLTGGEPLLRRELPLLVRRLAAIEGIEDIALTTNGLLLPALAQPLADAGLRRVTVSLDSLDAQIFAQLAGRDRRVEEVLAGIEAAERAGLSPIKINCVVQRDVNDAGVVDLVRHFRGSGHIVRFIEFMDVGTSNGWAIEKVVPARETLARIHAAFPLEPIESNYPGEVARRYRYADGQGEIGLIASVTAPFCAGCHRARLTTDGRLFTCLFGENGVDLRTPLRTGQSDGTLLRLLHAAWSERADRYSELRSAATTQRPRPEMYELGG